LTYIQAPEGFIPQGPNPATVLVTALAVLIICLGVFFGLIIGSSVGFAIMIGCALLGAGILSAEAASQCGL
jgi:hypothetical protein